MSATKVRPLKWKQSQPNGVMEGYAPGGFYVGAVFQPRGKSWAAKMNMDFAGLDLVLQYDRFRTAKGAKSWIEKQWELLVVQWVRP